MKTKNKEQFECMIYIWLQIKKNMLFIYHNISGNQNENIQKSFCRIWWFQKIRIYQIFAKYILNLQFDYIGLLDFFVYWVLTTKIAQI